MYDATMKQSAKVNSTDLNEDLGQIEFLFSDKTGTLTENEMIFRHFAIDGKIYEEIGGKIFEVDTGIEVPLNVIFQNDKSHYFNHVFKKKISTFIKESVDDEISRSFERVPHCSR